jgi:hypothetical protein
MVGRHGSNSHFLSRPISTVQRVHQEVRVGRHGADCRAVLALGHTQRLAYLGFSDLRGSLREHSHVESDSSRTSAPVEVTGD